LGKITISELKKIYYAGKMLYNRFNNLCFEYEQIRKRIELEESEIRLKKMLKTLNKLEKLLEKQKRKIEFFWEMIRETKHIYYPWQLEMLIDYCKKIKTNSVEFNFD